MKPNFKPGANIAMKVPPHEYADTVAFYRSILSLEELTDADAASTPRFKFGDKVLWIDKVAGLSQAEIWLQICVDDPDAAGRYLEQQGVVRCDAIEPLPQGFKGFWISSPANIIHLVSAPDKS